MVRQRGRAWNSPHAPPGGRSLSREGGEAPSPAGWREVKTPEGAALPLVRAEVISGQKGPESPHR